MKQWIILLLLLVPLTHSYSAGFEKVTMWSAKWSALAAAATASVTGSESLYFNPAGLVQNNKNDLSLNISSGYSQFAGPAVDDNNKIDGEHLLYPIPAFTSKFQFSDRLAAGFGVYISGGTKSKFEDLDFSDVDSNYNGLKPTQESSLSIIEIGTGLAYKLTKNWSVGATWRVSLVSANLSSAKAVTNTGVNVALINVHLKELSDQNFASFRLGTQYLANSKNWGIGLAYRSKVAFDAKGKSSGKYQLGPAYGGLQGNSGDLIGGGDVTISGQLPAQLSLGSFHRATSQLTLFSEITWTNYSQMEKLEIAGTAMTLPSSATSVIQDITQNWKDQWNFKAAAEYQFTHWALRGGYALTTQVTPDDYARVTFSSPGLGHSFIVGAGRSWNNGRIITDLAAEYSMASGRGTTTDGISGDFSVDMMVAHLSCKYLF